MYFLFSDKVLVPNVSRDLMTVRGSIMLAVTFVGMSVGNSCCWLPPPQFWLPFSWPMGQSWLVPQVTKGSEPRKELLFPQPLIDSSFPGRPLFS